MAMDYRCFDRCFGPAARSAGVGTRNSSRGCIREDTRSRSFLSRALTVAALSPAVVVLLAWSQKNAKMEDLTSDSYFRLVQRTTQGK